MLFSGLWGVRIFKSDSLVIYMRSSGDLHWNSKADAEKWVVSGVTSSVEHSGQRLGYRI